MNYYYTRVILENGKYRNIVIKVNSEDDIKLIIKEINNKLDREYFYQIKKVEFIERISNTTKYYNYSYFKGGENITGRIKRNGSVLKSYKDWEKLQLRKEIKNNPFRLIKDKRSYLVTILSLQLILWPFIFRFLIDFQQIFLNILSKNMQFISLTGVVLLYLTIYFTENQVRNEYIFFIPLIIMLLLFFTKTIGEEYMLIMFITVYVFLFTFIPYIIQVIKMTVIEIKKVDDSGYKLQTIMIILAFILSVLSFLKN